MVVRFAGSIPLKKPPKKVRTSFSDEIGTRQIPNVSVPLLTLVRLFFLLRVFLQTGVTASSKLGLELLDTARSVYVLQLARIERMADIADVNFHLFTRATRCKSISATASNLRVNIIRMNTVLHRRISSSLHVNFKVVAGSPQNEFECEPTPMFKSPNITIPRGGSKAATTIAPRRPPAGNRVAPVARQNYEQGAHGLPRQRAGQRYV